MLQDVASQAGWVVESSFRDPRASETLGFAVPPPPPPPGDAPLPASGSFYPEFVCLSNQAFCISKRTPSRGCGTWLLVAGNFGPLMFTPCPAPCFIFCLQGVSLLNQTPKMALCLCFIPVASGALGR